MDMSNNLQKDRLLEETISEILLLEYYGGGGAGDFEGYGVSEEFFADIWNAFIDPLKHVAAFVENFSSEIQRLAGKLAEDVMAVYLPGYKADYSDYEEEYKERQENISKKYNEVLSRTEAHLFTGDAALMGFLYAPHSYITTRMLRNAPDTALGLIDIFAGGNPAVKELTDKAREETRKLKHVGRMRGGPTAPKPLPIDTGGKKEYTPPTVKTKWWSPRKEPKGQDPSKRFYKKSHTESVQRDEEILNEGLKDIIGKIAGLFKKPEIEKAIEQSPLAKQMKADAEKYVKDYIRGVVDMTKNHMSNLKSTKTLDKATKGQFSSLIQKRGKEDAQKTAKLVVAGTKKGIKELATKELQDKIKQLPKGAAPLAKYYQAGINQIKSM